MEVIIPSRNDRAHRFAEMKKVENMMNKTFMAKPGEVEQRWWLVDANEKKVGRLASDIATILMGKHRPITLLLGMLKKLSSGGTNGRRKSIVGIPVTPD